MAAAVTLLALVVGLSVVRANAETPRAVGGRSLSTATARVLGAALAPGEQPNIVVVVMDDVSMDLVPTMRNLQRLERRAAVYDHAYVVNSLCCPSRAAMLTGRPPHLTGVLTNTSDGPLGPKGGYQAFVAHHGPQRSYNVSLRAAGYHTAFLGKYLNEYEPGNPSGAPGGARTPPPRVPGWDDFESISGEGYDGWGFYRTRPSARPRGPYRLQHYPIPERSAPRKVIDRTHVGTVIGDRAVSLARHLETTDQPYLLHVATYAAHARYREIWPHEPVFPPAFRDRPSKARPHGNCGARRCGRLRLSDLPGSGDSARLAAPTYLRPDGRTAPAPAWRTDPVTLSRAGALRNYRDRARMVQSADRMLGRLMRTVGEDTYLVVTSDNGLHLRQLGLNGGKGTPYGTDNHVPLVIAGPGVVPGHRDQLTSSIDLAATFEELAGAPASPLRAGVSLAPSLDEPTARGSRFTFFEHRQGPVRPGEPDADLGSGGRLDAIPSYVAVRSARGLLVRVDLERAWATEDFAWELYRGSGPEDRNVFPRLHRKPWVRDLQRRIVAWQDCGPQECRRLVR